LKRGCQERPHQERPHEARFGSRVLIEAAFLLFIFCVTRAVAPGQAPDFDSRAAKILSLEDARFDAQKRKDNVALDLMLDSAIVWVDPDGALLTKAEGLSANHIAREGILEIAPESMSVQFSGDTAVVIGIYRERGVRSGRPYRRRCRFMDTWVFKNGKWQCIAAASTSTVS
jgi:hypothetical protein